LVGDKGDHHAQDGHDAAAHACEPVSKGVMNIERRQNPFDTRSSPTSILDEWLDREGVF
jgi:hypothetical protein